ncbi:MAG: hypothetical protein K6F87_04145 [Lachnospiraceae bacterium]|nr:hypothetical protein [Lachnospiraceae bacterium]
MRRKLLLLILACVMLAVPMTGCDSTGAEGTDGSGAPENGETAASDYDNYIQNALANVDKTNTPGDAAQENDATPSNTVSVQMDRTAPDDDVLVSSMESPYTDDPFYPTDDGYDVVTPVPTETVTPTPTEDPNATPTPEPTPYITPDEFEVGRCCVYIRGESDSAFGTEIVTEMNKVRKDLGYDELIKNKSLSTCADRRTRETVALYAHARPNGEQFFSLAPEHFKAEMLITSNEKEKAEDIVDGLIKGDPISKYLIYTTKYKSVGASSFKVGGMHYTVVAFGL